MGLFVLVFNILNERSLACKAVVTPTVLNVMFVRIPSKELRIALVSFANSLHRGNQVVHGPEHLFKVWLFSSFVFLALGMIKHIAKAEPGLLVVLSCLPADLSLHLTLLGTIARCKLSDIPIVSKELIGALVPLLEMLPTINLVKSPGAKGFPEVVDLSIFLLPRSQDNITVAEETGGQALSALGCPGIYGLDYLTVVSWICSSSCYYRNQKLFKH